MIEAAGNDVDAIIERFIEYLAIIYKTYGKDVCIVPIEYLKYIFSMCSSDFGYRDSRKALSEFESRYSVIVHECDPANDWNIDYLLIQKEQRVMKAKEYHMLLSNEKYAKENVYWTLDFVLSANYYIYQCAAKQVEILAANKDTCDDTELPNMYDLIDDALATGADEEGECYNCWGVTDNYNTDFAFGCIIVEEDGKTILEGIDWIDGVSGR